MRLVTCLLVAVLAVSNAAPATAYGCFEPCPEGEVHSDELDMCVTVEAPST